MEHITAYSTDRQPSFIEGPTAIVIYADERMETVKTEEGTYEQYAYDFYRMAPYEYENVKRGILPDGAEWTDVLRGIERGFLYETADAQIMKYMTDVPDDTKRQAWVDYKHAVRESPNQKGYPEKVEYPAQP